MMVSPAIFPCGLDAEDSDVGFRATVFLMPRIMSCDVTVFCALPHSIFRCFLAVQNTRVRRWLMDGAQGRKIFDGAVRVA